MYIDILRFSARSTIYDERIILSVGQQNTMLSSIKNLLSTHSGSSDSTDRAPVSSGALDFNAAAAAEGGNESIPGRAGDTDHGASHDRFAAVDAETDDVMKSRVEDSSRYSYKN